MAPRLHGASQTWHCSLVCVFLSSFSHPGKLRPSLYAARFLSSLSLLLVIIPNAFPKYIFCKDRSSVGFFAPLDDLALSPTHLSPEPHSNLADSPQLRALPSASPQTLQTPRLVPAFLFFLNCLLADNHSQNFSSLANSPPSTFRLSHRLL